MFPQDCCQEYCIIQYCSTANWIEPNGAELKLVPVAMLTHIVWKFAKKRYSGKKRWKKDEKQHNEYSIFQIKSSL